MSGTKLVQEKSLLAWVLESSLLCEMARFCWEVQVRRQISGKSTEDSVRYSKHYNIIKENLRLNFALELFKTVWLSEKIKSFIEAFIYFYKNLLIHSTVTENMV